jgi:hypothetical protein
MPVVGAHDLFEQSYTAAFKARLTEHGLLINYENDRAAIDIGLHLYDPVGTPGTVGTVRVWFQLKGIRAETLTATMLAQQETIAVRGLRVDHVAYWFAQPEPLYLAVYVEALRRFLAVDVRELVEAQGGVHWVHQLQRDGQATVTLRVPLDATIEAALQRMPRHRSMRMDGPEFRGRPLGHRLDPLRSELDVLPPDLFKAVVMRLLRAHGFEPRRELAAGAFGDVGTAHAVVGRLHYRYEWTLRRRQPVPQGVGGFPRPGGCPRGRARGRSRGT